MLGWLFPGAKRSAPVDRVLEIEGLPLKVSVNARAKRISLRVCAGTRSLKLTVPPRVSQARAMAFLESQRGWIAEQAALRVPDAVPFRPGVELPLGDGTLLLARGTGRIARREGDVLLVPGDGALFAGRVRRWLAAEAQRTLEAETRVLAARTGKTVRQVRVGDFRSRWGSCARDGRITYNWRLMLAPEHVRHSVVAHEVAHLVEPNHGPGFWKLATELLGRSHQDSRAWLRANGPGLHSFGAEA